MLPADVRWSRGCGQRLRSYDGPAGSTVAGHDSRIAPWCSSSSPVRCFGVSTAGFDRLLLAASTIYCCSSGAKGRSWPQNRQESVECRIPSTVQEFGRCRVGSFHRKPGEPILRESSCGRRSRHSGSTVSPVIILSSVHAEG